jgi:peroxiredoxin Q/BCP
MVSVGSPAPSFTLLNQDGNEVSLDALAGSWVALWWYPKAATPG